MGVLSFAIIVRGGGGGGGESRLIISSSHRLIVSSLGNRRDVDCRGHAQPGDGLRTPGISRISRLRLLLLERNSVAIVGC